MQKRYKPEYGKRVKLTRFSASSIEEKEKPRRPMNGTKAGIKDSSNKTNGSAYCPTSTRFFPRERVARSRNVADQAIVLTPWANVSRLVKRTFLCKVLYM